MKPQIRLGQIMDTSEFSTKNILPMTWSSYITQFTRMFCKETLNMRHVLDVALKLLNTIYARGLYHTQFQDILQPVDDEYSDVRWLSVGNVFECLTAEKGNRVFPCLGRK
jgi:hypothetical protein